MGGLDTEIGDDTSVVALEVAWFEPIGIGRTVAAPRPALGGVGEVRARRRSVRDATGDRPLRRTARRDVSRADGARRRRRRPRPSRCPPSAVRPTCASARSTGSSAPTSSADDLPPLLDPIGFTVTGTGDVRTVALPTWRPDSTAEIDVIEEVARHYGYERLGKTVPKSVVHGGLSVRQQRRRLAARGAARPRDLRGDAESVPRSRHAATRRSARPCAPRDEPARVRRERAAHVAAARPAAGDRLQRVTSAQRRQALRDRPRLPAGRRRTAERVRIAGGGPRGRRGARRRSRCGASSPRRWAPARASISRRVPDGHASHAVGGAPGRTRAARRRRRGPSGGPRPIRRDRAGRDPRDRPRSGARPRAEADAVEGRRAGTRRATSTSPSSCPRPSPPSASTRRSGRARATCSSTSPCSTCTAAIACPTARRSLAYRLRLQAPDRNLTDGDIADVRRGVEAAATKLGADLRS